MESKSRRNEYVDVVRGIAMLIVVFGHTMTGVTLSSEDSFLFNIVWTLQMPLFILISGYVSRYSKPLSSVKSLFGFFGKRTLSYLLPWFVWTFFVRAVLCGDHTIFNIRHLLWHLDSGYWFLITIWTISMVYGLASCLSVIISKKTGKGKLFESVLFTLFYIIEMIILFIIGKFFGLSFFVLKLTLYYMIFYYAGVIYGRYRDDIISLKNSKFIYDSIIAICSIVWIAVMCFVNVYKLEDSGIWIILRAGTSLAGCVSVIGLVKELFENLPEKSGHSFSDWIFGGLKWVGQHSLEVYLVHYLLINLLKTEAEVSFSSIQGALLISANYMLSIVLIVIVLSILNCNAFLRFLLFGKRINGDLK